LLIARPAVAGASKIRCRDVAALTLLMSLLMGASLPRAQESSVCSGTMSASPLRQMAKPLVVSLERPAEFAANSDLAQAFLNGVQSAGPTLGPDRTGTTYIDASFSVQSKGGKARNYKDLSWLRGERVPGDMQRTPQGAHVEMTVYARDAANRSLVWTSAISCTIKTGDMTALAEGLGRIVGLSLGKSVPRSAI
jgi:hypothetical protein